MKSAVDFNRIMKCPPHCPLCGTKMEHHYDPTRGKNILACKKDRIAIDVMDPLVGRWEEKREKIPCPMCDMNMKVFFTSTGYMKAKCPRKKCGAEVVGSNPDRFEMAPALKLDGVLVDPKNTDTPIGDGK